MGEGQSEPVARLADAVESLVEDHAAARVDAARRDAALTTLITTVDRLAVANEQARVDAARSQGAPWPMVYTLVSFNVFLVLVLIGLYATSRGDDAGKAFDDASRALPTISAGGSLPQ